MFSIKDHRLLLSLIFVFLSYALTLTLLSIEGFPLSMQDGHSFPFLADKPVGEDGYYMMTVAWNMARGRGIVYNFDELTTGIQPLGTLLYAILAKTIQIAEADKWLFIRWVLFLGSLNLVFFGLLMGRMASFLVQTREQKFAFLFAFVCSVFNYEMFRLFTFGLETGFYLTLLAVCILYTLHLSQRALPISRRDAVVFGALLGLTIWARIDFGVVVAVFFLVSLVRRQLPFHFLLIAGATATVLIFPWFFYIHSVTGHWLPSSGPAQAAIVSSENFAHRLDVMSAVVAGILAPWFYTRPGGWFTSGALATILALVVLVLRNNESRLRLWRLLMTERHLSSWLLACISLLIVYPTWFWATHFYSRYCAPLAIPVIAIVAFTLASKQSNWPSRSQSFFIVGVCTSFFFWAFVSLHNGRIGGDHTVAAAFVKERFRQSKVGAFQSGVIGFFNPNVVNLDGKLNQRALEATARGELARYVEEENIEVLIDWPSYINRAFGQEWLSENWQPCDESIASGVNLCFVRKNLPLLHSNVMSSLPSAVDRN